MVAETRYDNVRRYFLRLPEADFSERAIPDILINCYRKKGYIECQTLRLLHFNQSLEFSHEEVILSSDSMIQELLNDIRGEIHHLFRVCESLAMLDMMAAFAQLVVTADVNSDYTRPEITDCIAIKSGRHPVREKVEFLSQSIN